MKQLYGKLWVKCTAIALLVVFAILFAASALGTAYLFTYGAYADGGEQVRQIAENEILQQTNGDGWTALHAWADDDKITRDLLRERYDPLTSNIYFKLTDKDTGKILFSTGALNKDDYTGKASAYYQQDMTTSLDDGSDVTAVYQAYLKSPLAPRDSALYIMTWVERLISARYLLIVLAVLLLAVCLFLFISSCAPWAIRRAWTASISAGSTRSRSICLLFCSSSCSTHGLRSSAKSGTSTAGITSSSSSGLPLWR